MIFNKKQEPRCGYCCHGRVLKSMEKVACMKAGVKNEWDSCRHFQYDPLKRVPEKPEMFRKSTLDEQEFSLEE